MRHLSFIMILLLCTLIGCKSDDLKAPVPAYLTIEDISVLKRGSTGFATDNITDARVFINDKSLGSFELPATIPIQQVGTVNLKIRGGIFNNGISNDRVDYPFYTTYEEVITFEAEKEVVINPQLEYFPTVDFDSNWSGEDFESGANFRDPYPVQSDTVFRRITDPEEVLEGNASGIAFLREDQNFFEAWTPDLINVPRDGTATYLEFDYKSTNDFAVSVYTNDRTTQLQIVFFRANSSWTKVYVDLGAVFSTLSTARNYNLAIGYSKSLGEEGRLLIDNVKLAHF